jgi:4-hydroxybenzoate polyprenyltransferase
MIYTPLIRAYRENNPGNIRKAVMAGVLSVIILDAAIAVIFMPWWYGLLILLLWPLSRMLSKLFAVT